MNISDRSNWNDRSIAKKSFPCAMVVRGNARFALKGLAVSVMLAFCPGAYALPLGGVVAAGGAGISSTAGSTIITQSTQNVAINWQSFNIGQGETVKFMQPNSNSVALNRVLGADPSSILGSMSANGKVFLVNPNGILFGKGAQVNVGGLVASTLNITDSDFMAGRYQFAGSSGASVVNQGSINADGGYVALLGANVGNDGTIVARLGTVALAAGNAITLDVAGDGLLNVTVNQGAVNALVRNGGLIRADGGQVLLTAMAAGTLLQSAVNNTGVIQAQTIENRNGTIRLLGDMQGGTVNVGGTLDASAPNGGNGGFIETSAAHVNIASGAKITTAAPAGLNGTWLIDPVDFTVGSAPGDNITGATLSGNVQNGNITITTVAGPGAGNGDIFVTEPITWNGLLGLSAAPTTLTLNALRNVYIGRNSLGLVIPTAAITPTNGSLILNAGLDVNIDAAISPTRGNLVVCCSQDINVNEAITTVNGSVLLSAGRDVSVLRTLLHNATAITATDGNIEICAGRDIHLDNSFNPGTALMTLTRGSTTGGQDLATFGVPLGLTLSAGTAGNGPGAAGGTLVVTNGGVAGTFITLTAGGPGTPAAIYYNPVSYGAPTNYALDFNGNGGPLTEYMLVFPDGASKIADGSTLTTFTGLKGAPPGVSLAGAGAANFDTAAVGVGKTVSFTGFTLTQPAVVTGGAGINYAFANSCCGPIVGKTTATITAAPPLPTFVAIPLIALLGEEMLGGEREVQEYVPAWSPTVVEFRTPPELLSLAPPVVVPPVVVSPPPPIYVPPVLPPKQDRN